MKKFFFLVSILVCGLSVATSVYALDLGGGMARGAATKAGYDAATNQTTFAATLGRVVRTVLSFAGVIFMSLMVYAGFLWMTAKGDEAQIEKAQTVIRGAVIGLVITLGAYSITNFVVPRVLERATGQTGAGTTVR